MNVGGVVRGTDGVLILYSFEDPTPEFVDPETARHITCPHGGASVVL